jgi:hypothetical protein
MQLERDLSIAKETYSVAKETVSSRRSVWDPETFAPGHTSRVEARPTGRAVSRERLGDWDGPMAVLAPLCLPTRQGGLQGQTESGGIVLAVMLEPERPEAV